MARLVVVAWSSAALGQLPCSYEVTNVPPFSSCFGGNPVPGTPTAINNLGHVLLFRSQCAEPGYNDTYVWTGGATATLIPRPPGMLGFTGSDLNDNGLVCGEAWYGGAVGLRGVIYSTNSGEWTVLLPLNPPLGWSSVSAINNNNEACGYRSIGSAQAANQPRTAFRWTVEDGITDLGLIDGFSTSAVDISPEGLVAVGLEGTPGGYRWGPNGLTSMGTLSGANGLGPSAIVAGGRMVGGSLFITKTHFWGVAVDFNDNVLTALPTPGPDLGSCTTRDVNSSGVILGHCQMISQFGMPPGPTTAFVWVDGLPVNLNTLLAAGANVNLRSAPALNESGVIIAQGRTSQGQNVVVVLTPRPRQAGDVNCDEIVNQLDIFAVIEDWGDSVSPADINDDGIVNVNDLLQVITNWTG